MAQQTCSEDKHESTVRRLALGGKLHAHRIALGFLIALSGGLFLQHLGSANITMYDEVIHANVIRNLAQDCCLPHLHRSDLGTDWRDWTNNSLWLHKPLLPFYITAAVYRTLGGSLWALRFPGAMFAVLTILVVYHIGRCFFDRWVGVAGAAIFGLSPFTNLLVHGRIFSGFPDLTFVFFESLALYLILQWSELKSKATLRWLGVVLGLAYFCKGGLALAPFVAAAIVAMQAGGFREILNVLQSVLIFAIVVVPEKLYWLLQHPLEYNYEQHQQLFHLFTNIEGLAAPWHAYFTRCLPEILGLPLISGAYFAIAWALLRYRRGSSAFILTLWILTYLVPLSFGVSKTDNFVFAVLPAIALLLPAVVRDLVPTHGRVVLLVCLSSFAAPILWRTFVKNVIGTNASTWSRLFDQSHWFKILVVASFAIAVGLLCLMQPPSRTTTVSCLTLTSILLLALYVHRDYIENKFEVTECNGAVGFSEQLQLRQAAYSLRSIVDRNSLIIMTQNRDLQYLYMMYWSGADAIDVCRRMPELGRFQRRPNVFLLTEGSLPAAAVTKLPLGNLYSLPQIPFELWSGEIRRVCETTLARSATFSSGQSDTLAGRASGVSDATSQSLQIAVSSSQNPARVNQAVTYTATVRALRGAAPTGNVTFTISGIKPIVATLRNGQATASWTFLYTGERSVTADYSGDSTYGTAVSRVLIQKVNY